jgi:D-xylose transport system ATP-binding protein
MALVGHMTILENIFLGSEIARNGVLSKDTMFRETEKYLAEVKLDLNPNTQVLNLTAGQQQLLLIAKAFAKKAEILVLDEPTAALNESESENLFNILREMKSKKLTCIYITSRLKEIFQLAERVTVLRDGKTVASDDIVNITENRLISLMVGREMTQRFPRLPHKSGEVVLEVKNWTVLNNETGTTACSDISFKVRKGEILGIAGLLGAGRSKLAMSLFGSWGTVTGGEIIIEGHSLSINSSRDAIKAGIGLLPDDRKKFGLVMKMNIPKNATLSSLDKFSKLSVINQNEEIKASNKYISKLQIKTPSIEQIASELSGGSQQKLVISKLLMTGPKVLILDEPTKGVDVGAKYEIYSIMNDLVDQGVCIVMISSELDEILGMADRIIVMHEGRINSELNFKEATAEKIMHFATGGL